jgi:hypothetical protein
MSYDIINDYDTQDTTNISVNYYWCIAVYNLKFPASFKRSKKNGRGASFDNFIPNGVLLKAEPLIIVDDCHSVTVTHTKSNHVGTLNSTLYPSKEYLSLINPGDYVFCWMVNSEKQIIDLVNKLKTGQNQPANSFDSGLKFYGRVNSIREQINQSPDGARQGRFLLTAHSFTELDATFFYEIHLSNVGAETDIATQFRRLGIEFDRLLTEHDNNGTGIIPNIAIVSFLDLFLGKGVSHNLKSGFNESAMRSTYGTSGAYAHIVPNVVGSLFNKTIKSEEQLKTADVLEVVTGVQKYSNKTKLNHIKDIAKAFNPDNTLNLDSRRFTGLHLLGRSSPVPPVMSNQSCWSLLKQYLNPACNEMYATLRVNPEGDITPTIIARQIPFTTEGYSGILGKNVTYFSELPRWKIPSVIVKTVDVGKSDALRINFVHVYGVANTVNARNITQQLSDAPPHFDDMDISRSGLRPYMATVPCLAAETADGKGPKKWMDLIQDFVIGQHMTLTGQIVTSGIQSPICVGDNVEWDNVLYHIESVSHSCNISPEGKKSFTTQLNVSNGVAIDKYNPDDLTDLSLYARVSPLETESNYLPQTSSESTLKSLQKKEEEGIE